MSCVDCRWEQGPPVSACHVLTVGGNKDPWWVRAVLLSVEEGENGRLQTTGCDEASTGRRWIVSASCSVGITLASGASEVIGSLRRHVSHQRNLITYILTSLYILTYAHLQLALGSFRCLAQLPCTLFHLLSAISNIKTEFIEIRVVEQLFFKNHINACD